MAEVVWLIGLFKELTIDLPLPMPMYCDSKLAIQIAANTVFDELNKYIDIDYHFIQGEDSTWIGQEFLLSFSITIG